MNKTIPFFLFTIVLLSLNACNQRNSDQNNKTDKTEKSTKKTTYLSVDYIFEHAKELSGKTVYVSGIIDHVCRHGGKRFKILSSDGSQELKIELGENFDIMDASLAGYLAKVIGKLTPTKMNAELVKGLEQKIRNNHKGEENTEHFKQEIKEIQEIYRQLVAGEIPFYITYSIITDSYELEK